MAKIITFEVGYCTHAAYAAVKGAGNRTCCFPARAYLLEANSNYWLWDTGYASHFLQHTSKGLFSLYRKLTPVYFNEYEALVIQLKAQGINQQDIQGLMISHFHGDHIAGLLDFPTVPFFAKKEAWLHVKRLKGISALANVFIPALIPDDFESRLTFIDSFEMVKLPSILAPFTEGYVLPNSNREIMLVDLPGHAVGQIGAFVQGEQGWTLLASDAAWAPINYTELKEPSIIARVVIANMAAYRSTLNKLHQLYLNGNVEIQLCHEGDL